jgi:hypothetical protein
MNGSRKMMLYYRIFSPPGELLLICSPLQAQARWPMCSGPLAYGQAPPIRIGFFSCVMKQRLLSSGGDRKARRLLVLQETGC